jgi:predicted nucleotidyltransferase
VRTLSLFGSATGPDFRPDSDVDLLVEFDLERVPGLLGLMDLKEELERLIGRTVDVVAHEYGRIDHGLLCRTACGDLPRLVELLRQALPPSEPAP